MDIKKVIRAFAHREKFAQEQYVETRGFQRVEGKLLADGFVDPSTGEVLDLETAYAMANLHSIVEGLNDGRK